MKEKILLTGGTGFVGRKVGKRLVQQGYDVVVVTRDAQKHQGRLPFPCTFVSWKNLSDYIGRENISHVVHLAGESVAGQRWNENIKKEIYDSRVQVTRLLVSALQKSGDSLKSLVSASAIGFYGERGEEELFEESSVGEGFLSKVCADWEQEVFKYQKEHESTRVLALRIGIVLGAGGGALAEMLPPFRDNYGSPLGSGHQWMSWIHIDDLVEMILWGIENKKAKGIYNAVSPEPIRNADFSKIFCSYFSTWLLPSVPGIALRALLGEVSRVILASQKIYPKKSLSEGFQFQFKDLALALKSLCPQLKPFESQVIFEQWVPHAVEKIFPFYENEQNLELITPPWLNFKVLGKTTLQIEKGTRINYKLSLHGIPMRWQTRIEEFIPNQRFVDTQVKGPYEIWHHTHEFEKLGSGTIVRDVIRYRVKFGALGYLASSWLVHRDIQKIFNYRAQVVAEYPF